MSLQRLIGWFAHTTLCLHCVCPLCCQDRSLSHGKQVKSLHTCIKSVYTVECLTFLVPKKFCRLIFIFGRKPYEISTLMNLYNLFQVVANVLLVYGYWTNGWSTYYNWCKYYLIKIQIYCLNHYTKQSHVLTLTNYFIQCVKAWILIRIQDLQATTWLLLP